MTALPTSPPAVLSDTYVPPAAGYPPTGNTAPPITSTLPADSDLQVEKGETVSISLVGQNGADRLDTMQANAVPSGLSQLRSGLVKEDSLGLTDSAQLVVAPTGTQSVATSATAFDQQDSVGLPGTMADVAKTVVSMLLSPLITPGPDVPVESPVLWAMLGWLRRESQRTTITSVPTVKAQENTLGLDEAGGQMALMTASAPTVPAAAGPFALPNFAPIAVPDIYMTAEDSVLNVGPKGLLANDVDFNGDALSATLLTSPKNGTVTLNADGSFSYTPTANYSGVDTFTYHVSDGVAGGTGTVSVFVSPVNDAPVSAADTYATAQGTRLQVTGAAGVLKNDPDPDGPIRMAQLVSGPSNGMLTLNLDGAFTYTPRAGYQGTDTFTYRFADGYTTSAPHHGVHYRGQSQHRPGGPRRHRHSRRGRLDDHQRAGQRHRRPRQQHHQPCDGGGHFRAGERQRVGQHRHWAKSPTPPTAPRASPLTVSPIGSKTPAGRFPTPPRSASP
ncbi:cadherin-like domain-containing protein [Mycolicibacterium novocastrense]|nr:cadherin-like domain-containing protein [Mycolicibacterium novocastrense]